MKNRILKERLLLNYFRPLLSGVCVLLVAATVLTGCTSKQEDTSEPAYTIVNPADCVHIPTQDQVVASLTEIFQSPQERYLRKRALESNTTNNFYRFPCPQNGEKIKVNFLWNCTEQDKAVFQYAINHYNQIFSVINPYYQFEANFAPTTQDILNPYSINVNHEEEFENNTWLGYASVPLYEDINEEYGCAILENKIVLKSDLLNCFETNSTRLLCNVFLHEMGHCLGFGDAYKNKNATKDTIMQKADATMFRLSETDIKVLNALYHEPKNQNSIEEIWEILDNQFLEENNPIFPYKSIRPVKDFFENIVQIIPTFSKNGMTPAEYLKSYVNKSNLLSNEEKAELSELIGDDLKYNETIDEAKFTYKYKDSYYGSESLNAKNLTLTRSRFSGSQHEGIRVGPAIVVNFISAGSLEDLYNYEYPSSLMVYFQLGDYLVGWEVENVIIKKGTYKIGDPSIKMKKENKDLTTNQTIQPSAETDFSK